MKKSKFFIPIIVLISITCIIKNKDKATGSDAGGKQRSSAVSTSDTISDSALLDLVEKQTFQYFYNGAESVSGMARERYHLDNIYVPGDDTITVASGGSGF